MPALSAFLAVSGQWRHRTLGQKATEWIGLDYGAVRAGLDLAGIVIAPDTWAELRLIEAGARDELNRDL